ncbi:L-threonylcarbamoyladenylate synthase [Halodesulfurarchaeum sp. HSR-GB]|uniref:L-threonylcarbamoyladenylate synthase n=1 Tax=Halodesulfurarchaeum sp. HSR-GB TaxID=3074077 RepID=UPI00285EF06A|nr:L-threonylcarbamoyladenylate synthase [Halodesulfurarchaeum sp. HSR-GB]MDR5656085.1 L-threonylcarbamoyladenylate synthase [Halodesulfurarchaeum sp. HSR-GB]
MAERLDGRQDDAITRAAAALDRGELVVYPTETVYGLGADALDPAAIDRVFDAKHRDRDEPVSLAVPSAAAARDYVTPSEREAEFMAAFLPGPVTVVLERKPIVPDVLTGGRAKVGIRVPDHAVAQALLAEFAPITATSANVSGRPSATRPEAVDPELEAAVAVILEAGRSGGAGSTVVDVATDELLREGPEADAIRDWLASH